eukprot:scaffold2221_cov192-Isochrysis_galbana.AAC.2
MVLAATSSSSPPMWMRTGSCRKSIAWAPRATPAQTSQVGGILASLGGWRCGHVGGDSYG